MKRILHPFHKMKGISKEYINQDGEDKVVMNSYVPSFAILFAEQEFTNPEKNNYANQTEKKNIKIKSRLKILY